MKKRKPTSLKSDQKQNQNPIKKLSEPVKLSTTPNGPVDRLSKPNSRVERLSTDWVTTVDMPPMAVDKLLIIRNLFGVSTYPLSTAFGPCRQRFSAPVSSPAAAMSNELQTLPSILRFSPHTGHTKTLVIVTYQCTDFDIHKFLCMI